MGSLSSFFPFASIYLFWYLLNVFILLGIQLRREPMPGRGLPGRSLLVCLHTTLFLVGLSIPSLHLRRLHQPDSRYTLLICMARIKDLGHLPQSLLQGSSCIIPLVPRPMTYRCSPTESTSIISSLNGDMIAKVSLFSFVLGALGS